MPNNKSKIKEIIMRIWGEPEPLDLRLEKIADEILGLWDEGEKTNVK